jgi:hypothetical protein
MLHNQSVAYLGWRFSLLSTTALKRRVYLPQQYIPEPQSVAGSSLQATVANSGMHLPPAATHSLPSSAGDTTRLLGFSTGVSASDAGSFAGAAAQAERANARGRKRLEIFMRISRTRAANEPQGPPQRSVAGTDRNAAELWARMRLDDAKGQPQQSMVRKTKTPASTGVLCEGGDLNPYDVTR